MQTFKLENLIKNIKTYEVKIHVKEMKEEKILNENSFAFKSNYIYSSSEYYIPL